MKTENAGWGRVLAVDVRPRQLGYVGIELPDRLLNFGVSRFKSDEAGGLRLVALLATFRPSVLVLRRIRPGSWRDRPRTRTIMRLMRRVARRSSIKVAFVSERQLRACFRTQGCSTKHEIASLLARKFPELAWQLPPHRRKPWEPEHWRMPMFDAAALAVVYLGFLDDPATTRLR